MLTVGTEKGLKESTTDGSMGTQTLPRMQREGTGGSKMKWEATCLWVDTERALEKMVDSFGNIHIQPGIGPLQFDLQKQFLALLLLQLVLQPAPAVEGSGSWIVEPLLVHLSSYVLGDKVKNLLPLIRRG